MTALLPLVLVVHIALALALLVPAVLLPFTLRRRATVTTGRGGVVRGLIAVQGRGTIIGFGLLVSGLALLAILGFGLLGQPWLLVALLVYAVNLALAFFVQRPGLRRLFGLRGGAATGPARVSTSPAAAGREPATGSEPATGTAAAMGDDALTALARRQRYLSYLMAGLIGTIGFLMSTKPRLW